MSTEGENAILVPSVWRDQGYLVLAFALEDDEVSFFSTLEGCAKHASCAKFRSMMKPQFELSPTQLALSFIIRSYQGLVKMRVKTERTLVNMLQREELVKMSERRLAEVYRSVMGSGPMRIAADQRDARIDEVIEKLKANAAKPSEVESSATEETGGEEKPKKARKPRKEKEAKSRKEKKAAEPKAPKEPKPPKEAKPTKEKKKKEKAEKDPMSPYRAGTMKARGWDLYLKNPDIETGKLATQIEALGATPASARGWIGAFRKYYATIKK